MRTLVLGLGNDLYGDDGVGVEVVRRLREKAAVEECSLSGLALLDVITGCDRLLLVDTIKRPRPRTGKISILRGEDLRAIPGPSPHYVSVPQMIEIGRRVGLRVPSEIIVVAVETKNMHRLGEGLSEDMRRSLPAIETCVRNVLRRWPSAAEAARETGSRRKLGQESRPGKTPSGTKKTGDRIRGKLQSKISAGHKIQGPGRAPRRSRP